MGFSPFLIGPIELHLWKIQREFLKLRALTNSAQEKIGMVGFVIALKSPSHNLTLVPSEFVTKWSHYC